MKVGVALFQNDRSGKSSCWEAKVEKGECPLGLSLPRHLDFFGGMDYCRNINHGYTGFCGKNSNNKVDTT